MLWRGGDLNAAEDRCNPLRGHPIRHKEGDLSLCVVRVAERIYIFIVDQQLQKRALHDNRHLIWRAQRFELWKVCWRHKVQRLGGVIVVEIFLADGIGIVAKNIDAVVVIEITISAQVDTYAIIFVTLLQRQGRYKREIVEAMGCGQALDKRLVIGVGKLQAAYHEHACVARDVADIPSLRIVDEIV